MMANFTDATAYIDSDTVAVERGEFITSIAKLCKNWSWSNRKVKTFLSLLQKEGMILYSCDNKKTIINISNKKFMPLEILRTL
jgi:DNA replication protein DnaD